MCKTRHSEGLPGTVNHSAPALEASPLVGWSALSPTRLKRLEDKPLDWLGALSRFDKLKALSQSKGLSNGLLHL